MNPLIQLKQTNPLFLVLLVLLSFALSPAAKAQLPPPSPDGGYPGENTAEGDGALFSLTIGTNNTAIGSAALNNNTTGSDNTAIGLQALSRNTMGNDNTAAGGSALVHNIMGNYNTATGSNALSGNTDGNDNTATGLQALSRNTTGSDNTAIGGGALSGNTTGSTNTATGVNGLYANNGSNNIALGFNAGINLTTGNNNIDIGNFGVTAEANTIRIGRVGTQTRTFIAGINVSGVSGAVVKVNSNGRLGIAPSSARFKDEIKPMDKASEAILSLKPVTFRYKQEIDSERTPQFGLVAEDVAKVNPDLVVRDAEGKFYTVRYDAVNAMLLNEFLKEHRAFLEEQGKVERLEKQVVALTEGLQKVSAQLATASPSLADSN